ncbi:glycosyltransferase family 4 protein [Candidatus Peregrinibacteria bacterium]|nr:glycosyltransferase family 4 protein [Candidatus Peregrinibacteria bacterium]
MRILVLNDDLTGSPANCAQMLNCGFERMGHEVTMLTSHRREKSPEILRKKGLVSLPISYRESLRHYHCLFSPSVSSMIKKEMERIKPNIVHAHNLHRYLTYDALRVACEYTPNVFITLHDVFSFAFHRLNTRKYLDSNGKDVSLRFTDHWKMTGLTFNPLRNLLIRSALRKNVRGIVAVSHALKRALDAHNIQGIRVIHNGIDVQDRHCDERLVDDFKNRFDLHRRKIILFGGRISPDKGTGPLLDVLTKIRHNIPDVLLLVTGDEKRWQECVKRAGYKEDFSDIVRCTGWLNQDQMKYAYVAADIVTVPSLCLDCFPQTNLEAMAARKPVIGTIFGGTPESVLDQVTGFVLDPRDTDLFAQKLSLLLHDETLAKKMGEAGRRRVEEEFSLSKQVDTYLELFEKS